MFRCPSYPGAWWNVIQFGIHKTQGLESKHLSTDPQAPFSNTLGWFEVDPENVWAAGSRVENKRDATIGYREFKADCMLWSNVKVVY